MGVAAHGAPRLRASRNILLGCLSSSDQALVEPHVEEVAATCGTALFGDDQALDALFFPGTALVSLEQEMGAGRMVEVGLVGREGMLGWAALLGADRSGHRAVVRTRPGTLLRVPIQAVRRACASSPSLSLALLQFVHVVFVQMTRAMTSNVQHSLDQRLARWLLMRHDRLGGDLLSARHDEIAGCLNVRRASITDQLHVIEGQRLIRCTRGRIVVRDRGGLERVAGDAYGTAESHYRQLIGPFGKTGASVA